MDSARWLNAMMKLVHSIQALTKAVILSSVLSSNVLAVTWDDGVTDEPGVMGDGISWNDRFNWDTDEVPTVSDAVLLTTELIAIPNSVVAVAASLNTGSTDLNVDGTLIVSGPTTSDSTITIVADDSDSTSGASVTLGEGSTLGGDGELVLRRSQELGVAPATLSSSGLSAATLDATYVLRGEGDITANLINNGLIRAEDLDDNPAAFLRIIGPMQNNNIVQSTSTAQIRVSGELTQSATGQLIADANTVRLSQTTITGGTLSATSGGDFVSGNGTIIFDGVLLDGPLTTSAETTGAAIQVVNNPFTIEGTLTLGDDEDDGESATLTFGTSETITGSGEIVLNNSTGVGARINSSPGAQGTIGASLTIRGVGEINADLIHNGVIVAEPQIGDVLELSAGPKLNNGLIRADADATLTLFGVTVSQNNATGQILANEGTVELSSATIVGGRLEANGAGVFTTSTSGQLEDVVNNAPFDIVSGGQLTLSGSTVTNNDAITINSDDGVGITQFVVEEDLQLDGSGEVILNRASIGAQIEISGGSTLTNAIGHTVRGIGQINGPGIFINNGRVEGGSSTELIEINGRLGGDGDLKDVRIDGVHAPGESTAVVSIEGVYTVSLFGTVEIELGGLVPGSGHDQLNSNGTINLTNGADTLDVTIVDGFVPNAGDTFTVITTTEVVNGAFNIQNLPANIANFALAWEPVAYDGSSVVLEVASVAPLPGDYNADGVVGLADYTVWRDQLGATELALFSGADGDGDGEITIDDYIVWKNNFGGAAPEAITVFVPEPTGLLLLLGSWSAVVFWRKRRRQISSMAA